MNTEIRLFSNLTKGAIVAVSHSSVRSSHARRAPGFRRREFPELGFLGDWARASQQMQASGKDSEEIGDALGLDEMVWNVVPCGAVAGMYLALGCRRHLQSPILRRVALPCLLSISPTPTTFTTLYLHPITSAPRLDAAPSRPFACLLHLWPSYLQSNRFDHCESPNP